MPESRRGANLPAIGGFNRTVVLDAIRRSEGGLSRVELADRTGLSAQTVSNVTRRLLDVGMIVETGTVAAGRGKPRTMLRLVPDSRYAVGVHVDPAVVTYVLLDLAGVVVLDARTSTPSAENPEQVVATIASAIADLVRDAGIGADLVMGVGVASPGPIDLVAGVVVDPPFLPRWRDVALRDALAVATGLPVLLEKDTTAAAVGEMWLAGEQSSRNFAFVYYGTGFGVGLVLDHEPVRGVGANAGDAGHIVVEQGALAAPVVDADRGDPVASEGRGEVGDTVAPARLVALARGAGLRLPDPVVGVGAERRGARAAAGARAVGVRIAGGARPAVGARAAVIDPAVVDVAFTELSVLLEAGDPVVRGLAEGAGSAMGRAAVVIVNLLDVDRVVFGGPFWSRIAAVALPAAARAIHDSPVLVAKHPIAVVDSAIGDDVAAVGAACLVLDAALSPRASALLIRP